MRRGKASRKREDLDDEEGSDYEHLRSDVEDEVLGDWLLTTQPSQAKVLIPGHSMVKKYLPPGTLRDLFHHYEAAQAMMGAKAASFLASYSSFRVACWGVGSDKVQHVRGHIQTPMA